MLLGVRVRQLGLRMILAASQLRESEVVFHIKLASECQDRSLKSQSFSPAIIVLSGHNRSL